MGVERRIAGAMLFGAAAKAVMARDRWIGWTKEELSRYRVRIVNQSRFLILPGVEVPHLASHALSLAARRLPRDWVARYGYAPVLFRDLCRAAVARHMLPGGQLARARRHGRAWPAGSGEGVCARPEDDLRLPAATEPPRPAASAIAGCDRGRGRCVTRAPSIRQRCRIVRAHGRREPRNRQPGGRVRKPNCRCCAPCFPASSPALQGTIGFLRANMMAPWLDPLRLADLCRRPPQIRLIL